MDPNKQPENIVEALAIANEWNFRRQARIEALENELAEARDDGKRMDYLENEMEYEMRCIDHGVAPALSLFRRNKPITRKDIDEMRGVKP